MAHPKPRKWYPRNVDKYQGDANNIIARSSWEIRLFNWLDSNTSILKWASEELFVPYISPADNRVHRYFVDAIIQYKTNSGEIKVAMVEVKPHAQRNLPKPPKKQTQRYLNEVVTYSVNQAKWKAATEYANKKGWSFLVVDEYDLGIAKKRPKAK